MPGSPLDHPDTRGFIMFPPDNKLIGIAFQNIRPGPLWGFEGGLLLQYKANRKAVAYGDLDSILNPWVPGRHFFDHPGRFGFQGFGSL